MEVYYFQNNKKVFCPRCGSLCKEIGVRFQHGEQFWKYECKTCWYVFLVEFDLDKEKY